MVASICSPEQTGYEEKHILVLFDTKIFSELLGIKENEIKDQQKKSDIEENRTENQLENDSAEKQWNSLNDKTSPIECRILKQEEAVCLFRLYYMYEFSDHFLIISPETRYYGNLLHFINTGILTTEEAAKALLY